MDEREHEHENDMKPQRGKRRRRKGKGAMGSCVHHRRELVHKCILVSGKEEKTINNSVVISYSREKNWVAHKSQGLQEKN